MTLAFLLALTAAAPDLAPHMRILGVALEKATLADVQRVIGPAEIRSNGSDAGGNAWGMCFSGPDGTRLYFFADGEMGGSRHLVGGWQRLTPEATPLYAEEMGGAPLNPSCRQSGRVARATTSKGGLRLGMTPHQVARLLGPPHATSGGYNEYRTEEPVAIPGGRRKDEYVRIRTLRVVFSQDR